MENFCNLCPNLCGVDRKFNIGRCGANADIKIAKYYLHPFEEPIISGEKGSGTIFFTGCSLRCVFCQNYELSRNTRGKVITPLELSNIFKELEEKGATNINLVTPTHYIDKIIEALEIYKPSIPIVYNTHSYETMKGIEKISKYVDVFLPDLKFYSPFISGRYTGIENYFEIASEVIKFMMDLKPYKLENRVLKSGVIIRHLILPQCQKDSVKIVDWYAKNKKNGAIISVMSQYTPFGNIDNFPELKRKITKKEYQTVIDALIKNGIDDCFIQELSSAETSYIPKWDF